LAASADAGLSAATGNCLGLSATTDSRGLPTTAYDGWLTATAVNDVSHGIFLLFKLLLIRPLICRLLQPLNRFVLGYYPTPASGCWQLTAVGSCRLSPKSRKISVYMKFVLVGKKINYL